MNIQPRMIFIYVIVFGCLVLSNTVPAGDKHDYVDTQRFDSNFWIGEAGPTGPIFSGPQQYPFICTTVENGLGQPMVDNQDGIGNAVFPEFNGVPDFTADPVGYSKYCSIATRVDYLYYSKTADNFLPLPDPGNVPADVEQLTLHGKLINFVVRLERGTIDRFIYSIAMLAPYKEKLDKPKHLDNRAWNRKLVYSFQGGVGLGHFQGFYDIGKQYALHYDALKRGYAVAYSTGNRAGTHYNLTLMEENALMVKGHFKAIYGNPKFTIGVGGSGGAIQQYVLAQNNRHIIDAAIPQLSYPDMVTQTIYLSDCELLERYFDTEYSFGTPPLTNWADWLERGRIEGLATNATGVVNPWSYSPYAPSPGSSECINGWREIIHNAVNPKLAAPDYFAALQLYRYPPQVVAAINWSYWDDLGNIYPQDSNGLAYNTVDNVGIQYGLRALRDGDINKQQFLDLNSCVGGWKQPNEMTVTHYPWNPLADPSTFDPWGQENINWSPLCKVGFPAARTEGNIAAMNAAFTAGQVFTGNITIPIIDMRWYLDPVLDMHHSEGSFAVRARMLNSKNHAKNQVIWEIECSSLDLVSLHSDCGYNPTGKALDLLDLWLTNLAHIKKDNKHRDAKDTFYDRVIASKPDQVTDACYYGDGNLLYAGDDAWDGILNKKPAGICSNAYPVHATPRIVAGESIDGDIFKCALKPVDEALADGTYGDIIFNQVELLYLHAIFPSGVCDYAKSGQSKSRM